MLETIREVYASLPPAAGLIIGMVVVAALDFVAAMFDHIRHGTFHTTLIGKWASTKGLPIISVTLLFVVDQAVTFLRLPVEGFDIGAFGMLATAQAGTFIIGELASIQKHLQAKPHEDEVEEYEEGAPRE